jgi:hypothetical protein
MADNPHDVNDERMFKLALAGLDYLKWYSGAVTLLLLTHTKPSIITILPFVSTALVYVFAYISQSAVIKWPKYHNIMQNLAVALFLLSIVSSLYLLTV